MYNQYYSDCSDSKYDGCVLVFVTVLQEELDFLLDCSPGIHAAVPQRTRRRHQLGQWPQPRPETIELVSDQPLPV